MPGDNPTVEYNLLNDDAVLYLVTAIFNKLATSPLAQNTTYGFSIDANKLITVTDTSTNPATTVATLQTMNSTTVQGMIDTAIGQITGISFEIVASYADLPVTGENGVIYLVPISGASSPNVYEEYIWIGEEDPTTHEIAYRYEKIGTTDIDLSGYVQFSDITIMTNQQIATAVNTAYEAVWPTPSNNG